MQWLGRLLPLNANRINHQIRILQFVLHLLAYGNVSILLLFQVGFTVTPIVKCLHPFLPWMLVKRQAIRELAVLNDAIMVTVVAINLLLDIVDVLIHWYNIEGVGFFQ